MKRVLLLGGTGAMGKHLATILVEQNYDVYITTRKIREGHQHIYYIVGNAHDICFLTDILAKCHWDAIVDFMIYETEEFKQRVNLLLNATDQYVFLSSARVYADSKSALCESSDRLLDVIQDDTYLSTDEYALKKARQEDILQDSNHKNWTIIRPYITYSEIRLQLGVMEKESWLYRAMHGRTIVFSKDIANHITTLTYGWDVAKGIASIIGKPTAYGEIFHITAAESIYWKDVLQLYLEVLEKKNGQRPKVILTEHALNLQSPSKKYQVMYDRHYNRTFDNAKIGHFIDYHIFKSPRTGLKQCLEAFIEHPDFNAINWIEEAQFDKLSKERTPLKEIPSWKQKIKYLLFRYFQ